MQEVEADVETESDSDEDMAMAKACMARQYAAAAAAAQAKAGEPIHPRWTAGALGLTQAEYAAADAAGHALVRPIGVTVSIDHVAALRDLGTVTDDEEAADEARRLVVGPHW